VSLAKDGVMRLVFSLRAWILLALILGMGALVWPTLGGWIAARLNGPSPEAVIHPGAALEQLDQPTYAERVSPASYDGSNPADGASLRGMQGLDSSAGAPPSFATLPTFEPLAPPAGAAEPEAAIDEATIARLQAIRSRLEEAGAEYVIVETTEGSGRYRFHCRMLVDPRSRFTRSFEAISSDPLAAGEQVLREVEAWRMAAREKVLR
jgi:hypothetical protein